MLFRSTWKYSGSLDNSTWTDTATTGNGQDIGAYRYYKVQSVMATTNSDTTPSFNFIEIDPSDFFNIEAPNIEGGFWTDPILAK